MGRRIMLVALAWLAATTAAHAQGTGRVTGQVVSSEGSIPLAGATIVLVGTTRATLTDNTGRFTLADVPAGSRRIQARRLGFVSQTLPITVTSGQATNVNVVLVVSPLQLEEIRTVGYGSQDTRTVTGAVSTVTAEQIKDIPTYDPAKALQGRVPGVEVIQSNNEPGSAYQVRIRGVRSLSASNEPLYVVDDADVVGAVATSGCGGSRRRRLFLRSNSREPEWGLTRTRNYRRRHASPICSRA
ncbi:MAG: carboxypeptidase regulatory-like domain-containing protein [Gemmatimonadaceae bacterium]